MAETINRKPLLNDAEQNLGNSYLLQPQAGTQGTVIPQLTPGGSYRFINLTGGSSISQTTSVVLAASRVINSTNSNPGLPVPQNPNPGLPGPLTAIIEFGNGSRTTRVEVDVPIGPFVGLLDQPVAAVQPQDGGVIITVPTSVLRVYGRYDNLLIAPVLNTNPPQSLAQIFGLPFVGPGGPSGNPVTPAEPLQMMAASAYFAQPRSRAYKTNYLYASDISAPQPINVNTRQYFCLPAFTRKLKVLRTPISAAISIVIRDGLRTVDQVDVAGGTSCPEITIVGHECVVGIQSPLPADNYTLLALACEIGV